MVSGPLDEGQQVIIGAASPEKPTAPLGLRMGF
jgi:hypothetical protein